MEIQFIQAVDYTFIVVPVDKALRSELDLLVEARKEIGRKIIRLLPGPHEKSL